MRVIKSIPPLRTIIKTIKSKIQTIGFVPTMGALHDGHVSLIRKSRRENDTTIVSIFVNPKQFGPKEDFSSYPRQEKKDILLAKKEMVDIIFYPSEKEMYPTGFLTSIQVNDLSERLCGAARPRHFQGVATVVGKLLNLIEPDILYLGQKDAQQAIILKRMIADLNYRVSVRIAPTIREIDGLAMSSRNIRLTPRQRKEAPWLFWALRSAQKEIRRGERNSGVIIRLMRSLIKKNTTGKVEYVACVSFDSLTPVQTIHGRVLIALAVHFGRTRLIDNVIVTVK